MLFGSTHFVCKKEYLEVEDCADVVDEGSEDDDAETDTAGFSPVGLVHSGLVISWVGLVEGEQKIEVITTPKENEDVECLLWKYLVQVEEPPQLLDGDVVPNARLSYGCGVCKDVSSWSSPKE